MVATNAPQQQEQQNPFTLPKSDFEQLLERDFYVKEVDEAAQEASDAFYKDTKNHYEKALWLARGVSRLDALLDDWIMDMVIMPLMNKKIGFKTDRARGNDRYNRDEVRSAIIEGLIRGAYFVGNEINIISGQCYLTKEFFERRLKEHPGLTELVKLPGVPNIRGDSGIVPYRLMWKVEGKQFEITRDVPIKVNAGQSVDAAIGKATRKILAQAYDMLTGSAWGTPDGEVDEADMVFVSPGSAAPRNGRLADAQAGLAPANGHNHAPPPAPAAAPAPPQAPPAASTPPAPPPPAQQAPVDAPARRSGRPGRVAAGPEPTIAPAAAPVAPPSPQQQQAAPQQQQAAPPQSAAATMLADPRSVEDIADEFINANTTEQLRSWIVKERAVRAKLVDGAVKEAGLTTTVDADDAAIRNVAFNLKMAMVSLERRRQA